MERIKILEWFFPYIRNGRTKEIHRVKSIRPSCQIHLLRNGRYCTRLWAWWLFKNGYNGCRWCFGEKDNG